MCVIIIKPSGCNMPDESTLYKCWTHNPHGAGFAWSNGERVRFRKGFMTFDALMDAMSDLPDLTDHSLIVHFRFATHGGFAPAMTHPFSCVSGKPTTRLSGVTKLAVFHNGIIPGVVTTDNLSDTAVYTSGELHNQYRRNADFYRQPETLRRICERTGSRFAFLSASRWTATPGFYKCDELLFSNMRWQ